MPCLKKVVSGLGLLRFMPSRPSRQICEDFLVMH